MSRYRSLGGAYASRIRRRFYRELERSSRPRSRSYDPPTTRPSSSPFYARQQAGLPGGRASHHPQLFGCLVAFLAPILLAVAIVLLV